MAREKGAAPSRRGPSRSGRASFDADPTPAKDGPNAGTPFASLSSADDAGSAGVQGRDLSTSGSVTSPSNERLSATVNGKFGSGKQGNPSDESKSSGNPGEGVDAGPSSPTDATAAITPRGRGRPRKKLSEPKELVPKKGGAISRAGMEISTGKSSASASAIVPNAAMMDDGGNKRGAGVGGTPAPVKTEEDDSMGNESDEWSDDEIHNLPKEVKAQFGNVSFRFS